MIQRLNRTFGPTRPEFAGTSDNLSGAGLPERRSLELRSEQIFHLVLLSLM